jgi:tetratricopeptide (TPR) repeat protein
MPEVARSLLSLADQLQNVGNADEALAATQEAVAVIRTFAAAEPSRFEPDLASALQKLSDCLRAVQDPGGSVSAIREAVAIRRRLAAVETARFSPDLAASLRMLAYREIVPLSMPT